MAIVVKEASNTPLAIAALAKNMADTYVNWNNSERDYAKWQQEQTWRNEDRELGRKSAEALSQLGPDAFLGGQAGLYGAMANARGNEDFSGYLLEPNGGRTPAEWENKVTALTDMYQRQGFTPQQAADRALVEVTNPYDYRQSPIGLDGYQMSPGMSAIGQSPILGTVNATGDYEPNTQLGNAAMPGGNGAVAVGTPTPQAPSMTGKNNVVYVAPTSGQQWTQAEVEALAARKGKTPQQMLELIKQRVQ